jgi:uncharacterized coiled-coil protein SlyX
MGIALRWPAPASGCAGTGINQSTIAMNERTAELETRLAFQERTLQELNEVVVRQQGEIDRLIRELETLKTQMRSMAPYPVAGRDEETPPPHY